MGEISKLELAARLSKGRVGGGLAQIKNKSKKVTQDSQEERQIHPEKARFVPRSKQADKIGEG